MSRAWNLPPTEIRRRMAEIRIGEEIRRLRELKGISLRELSRKVDLSPAMVSDVEHGRRGTTRLPQIAKLLGVAMSHFRELAGICEHCCGTGFAPGGR